MDRLVPSKEIFALTKKISVKLSIYGEGKLRISGGIKANITIWAAVSVTTHREMKCERCVHFRGMRRCDRSERDTTFLGTLMEQDRSKSLFTKI